MSFDKYYRNFGLLGNALKAKKKLKEDERNSLFIHGIPYSLHKKIIDELLCTNDWKNKDVAPEMDKVINATKELLKIGQFDFKNMNACVNYEQESEAAIVKAVNESGSSRVIYEIHSGKSSPSLIFPFSHGSESKSRNQ